MDWEKGLMNVVDGAFPNKLTSLMGVAVQHLILFGLETITLAVLVCKPEVHG